MAACIRATGPRLTIGAAAPLARPLFARFAPVSDTIGFGVDAGGAIGFGSVNFGSVNFGAAVLGAADFGAVDFAAMGERFCTIGEASSASAAIRKKATRSSMALAWCSSVFAVAAFSSTSAEFCWVTSSIWLRALLTCSMPVACSVLAVAMPETISATFLIDSTISLSAVPALLTRSTPSFTWLLLLVIRSLMSFAACDERCARLRTSDATTAKPRPASPARAASTAAFSASKLVCRAISSITVMMSDILREDSSIRAMASTALATTCPPRSATSRVPLAD